MARSQPEGYLAVPDDGQGTAVLVLHAWWGLNETIKGVCDRLAQEGFVAYAPDLYHGRIAQTIAAAESLSGQAEIEPIKADIAAAVAFLSQQATPAGGKLSVIGFSFGAYFALALAVDRPERIHTVTLFYGTGEAAAAGSQAAYLGHFAAEDEYEPAEFVDQLEASLKAAGRPATFYRYPGVGHWFFEPDRPDAYNQAAAELAWERTVAFLKETRVS
jgi:carboxymethylenebutenolidase